MRPAVMFAVNRLRPEVLPVRHGFRLRIPADDASPYTLSLFLDGEYEPEETRLVAAYLRPGDVAFDVGANIGYMTCLMARQVGRTGRVHAFEPNAAHGATLRTNLELNGIQNVVVNQCALGREPTVGILYLSAVNRGDHSLVPVPGRRTEQIEVFTFDQYRERYSPETIRLVKIDVQGYELHVLEGMRRSLSAGDVDVLIVEFWPARIRMSGERAAALPAMLSQLPYEVSIVSHSARADYRTLDDLASACEALEAEADASFNLLLRRRGIDEACSARSR